MLPAGTLPFTITSPLGIPRPLKTRNVFGATLVIFSKNAMPVPTGCLTFFDSGIYRPYVNGLLMRLRRHELGWSSVEIADDPPRYCFMRDGVPAEIPEDIRPMLPQPPRVSVEQIFEYFHLNRGRASAMQLLDLLTLFAEDLGPAEFAKLRTKFPWVADFMR